MKKFFLFSFFTLVFLDVFSAHITGGEMIYEYLGPGSTAGKSQYKITLKLFRDETGGGAAMPLAVQIGIYANNSNILVSNLLINRTSILSVPVEPPPICMDNPPTLNYTVGFYEFIVELTDNAAGYTVAYNTCCRINSLQNVLTAGPPAQGEGSTYVCVIPGTDMLPVGHNSSPQFSTLLAPVCYNTPFSFNFSATDPDGDSLVYFFCNAYNRGSSTNSANVLPPPPPYQSVVYTNGFSASSPLGSQATVNNQTGIISGIAPPNQGNYVVCVCILEYRNGVLIGTHRKDFIIRVNDCSIPNADLDPEYITCDGFSYTFQNNTSSPIIQTFYWEFGDGGTSTAEFPTWTYADTGTYTIKLVVNRGLPCSDSATAILKVYPGFTPDFEFLGQCKNTPIQFTDRTVAAYGFPSAWTWYFNDPSSGPNDSSHLQNPTHIFATAGSYNVRLIAESSKGCKAIISKTIDVLSQPPLTLTNDTLICSLDTLQLNAVGTGSFLWSPNYMISNVNIANPLVSPDVPTTYYVTITDAFGCTGIDSVKVNVKSFVTLFGGADTTICRTDTVVLKLTSDALNFIWTETPAGNTLNNPTLKNPTARPLVTTTYHVVGNIGKCIAEDDITITPVPYPVANAGPDNTICFGQSAQLQASGGSIYSWSPAAFLTATNIPNPVSVRPTDNVRYIVTVRDVLGCPKSVKDTMILYVAKIVADAGPRDTSVVLGQPLQLGASGSINYAWTPTTWLNNPAISNPISFPQNDIEYVVRVSNNVGCFDTDSIRVRVFKIKPDLLVPNAFTPNGNGNNDIFKPIPIGMKSVDIFRVYNRWGQMLYSGTGNGAGWDGKFAGKLQETATYVWYAEGTDYLNNKIKRKGSVVLIH